ncbi:NUDIX domain-containing protein [Octadecabacter ascidiaceicola]|uniref:ADP-ribose pyrophosphatase n=1 Tax=Octadecabacter ascidiaceicola TaxID=1655543 RepID=A0A238JJZ4_9RHOB|nr:NUDIX domain-containing protein [Octadecabacter ascidiaceicola]SMX30805.1 ADP-ribose pyrophosphatase [Octadecabacter ascidiaceicola]
MDVFIFGTLLHMPLLEVVSGDSDVTKRISWAVRPGYRVSRVDGHEFPIMHEDADSVAEGVVIEGLSDAQLERLDFYEKAFDYSRVDFVVLDRDQAPRSVTAYVPPDGRWTPAEPWNREKWISDFGEVTTMAAIEAIAALGNMTPMQMGLQYPNMMSRAASRQRAAKSGVNGRMGREDVHLIEARKAYAGFFNVEELDLTFRRFDGSMSEPVNRAVFVGVDAAIVLPYDPVRDRVMLVEQFRPGAYFRGDPNPWTLEPIAGRIDPGEEPEEAAIREAQEEAGIKITSLRGVSAAYPSPGTTTEHFYVFIGITELPDGAEGVAGNLSEAEDIRSQVMDWTEFDAALNAGEFRLLPLLVAGHWLARNRESLRASA